jgi:hypothetical protein
MGEWSEAMQDGVICPHCFSVLVADSGSLISCDCGGASQSAFQTKALPRSDEERKQAREAANRDAERRLERKQRSEWEAERARILRSRRDDP